MLRVSGAMNSIPTITLEVLLHCLPLHLRLEEVLVSEGLCILRKPMDDPVTSLVRELWEDKTFMNGKITPLHTIKSTLRNIRCEFLINSIEEPAPPIHVRELAESPNINIDNHNFGSASNRTSEQSAKAQLHTLNILSKISENEPVCLTDGSALGNPGPC